MKTMKQGKIAVIGGDPRVLTAAAGLRETGYEVTLYGFDTTARAAANPAVDAQCCSDGWNLSADTIGSIERAGILCQTPEKALKGCQTAILPLPASVDGVHVSTPLSPGTALTLTRLVEMMSSAGVRQLCGGRLGSVFTAMCKNRGIEVFDYYEREEFAVANAIPTAEGAIAIAMNELPITLHGASALVIGNGRIGKVLARLLAGLHVDVTVSARKPADFAWIRAEGLRTAETGKLSALLDERRYDMIFNTVPHTVLGRDALARIAVGTLIVDLASRPGGVDIGAAKELGHNVIWALSLPGKVAPITSGRIIADTVLGCIGEGASC